VGPCALGKTECHRPIVQVARNAKSAVKRIGVVHPLKGSTRTDTKVATTHCDRRQRADWSVALAILLRFRLRLVLEARRADFQVAPNTLGPKRVLRMPAVNAQRRQVIAQGAPRVVDQRDMKPRGAHMFLDDMPQMPPAP